MRINQIDSVDAFEGYLDRVPLRLGIWQTSDPGGLAAVVEAVCLEASQPQAGVTGRLRPEEGRLLTCSGRQSDGSIPDPILTIVQSCTRIPVSVLPSK